jgi:hypothetical protein
MLKGDKKHRARVLGEPDIVQGRRVDGEFHAELPTRAPAIGYCALPGGEVVVSSRWLALKSIEAAELVDHPFRWVEIEKFISKPEAKQVMPGVWKIDGKLRMQILSGAPGEIAHDGINGSVRRNFSSRTGEVLQNSMCLYQPISLLHAAPGDERGQHLKVGDWSIQKQRWSGIRAEKEVKPTDSWPPTLADRGFERLMSADWHRCRP